MKVTVQESLSRAGITPDQYQIIQQQQQQQLQQQQQQQQLQQQPGAASADVSDMGRQIVYPHSMQENYMLEQLSALFGGNPEDLDPDLDDADSPYGADGQMDEVFMRMLADIPTNSYAPAPGKQITSDTAAPVDTPSTSSAQSQTGEEPSPGTSMPASLQPEALPQSTMDTAEAPKIQIKLRKAADAEEGGLSSEAGLQMLENMLKGQVQNPLLMSSNPTAYGRAIQRQEELHDTSPNEGGAPVITYEDSLSPAPSSVSEAPNIHGGRMDHMETVIETEDSISPQNQSATATASSRKGARAKTSKPQGSPVPDTSSLSDKPVKTKPVDVDSVMERNRKNAIQARLNRQKKKAYMENLEDEVGLLKSTNEKLDSENKALRTENAELKEELQYVKNVLANQSSLAGLLKDIGHSTKARLTSSFFSRGKRSSSEAELADQTPRKVGSGVCLHVDKDSVSFEVCSKCSLMAQGTSRYDLPSSSTTEKS